MMPSQLRRTLRILDNLRETLRTRHMTVIRKNRPKPHKIVGSKGPGLPSRTRACPRPGIPGAQGGSLDGRQ